MKVSHAMSWTPSCVSCMNSNSLFTTVFKNFQCALYIYTFNIRHTQCIDHVTLELYHDILTFGIQYTIDVIVRRKNTKEYKRIQKNTKEYKRRILILGVLRKKGDPKRPLHCLKISPSTTDEVTHILHTPEESWVLSNNVHDIGSNNSLVVLPSLLLTEAQQFLDDSHKKSLLIFFMHGPTD